MRQTDTDTRREPTADEFFAPGSPILKGMEIDGVPVDFVKRLMAETAQAIRQSRGGRC